MKIDIQAALMGHAIANDLAHGRQIFADTVSAYYSSDGIRFLKHHLHRFGGFDLTEERFSSFFHQPCGNNVFTKSILQAMALAPSPGFNAFDNVREHIERFKDEVEFEVARYLPDGESGVALSEVAVYLLFGIRGTSIVLGNEIAVDLCDESLYENGSLSLSRLKGAMAHEVHHIAVSHKCAALLDRAKSDTERARYAILEGLIGEGMASFYFTPFLSEQNSKQWERNLSGVEQKINALYALLYDASTTATQLAQTELALFGEDILGYTMGYFMIEKIHKAHGPAGVIALLSDFQLFDVYYALSGFTK